MPVDYELKYRNGVKLVDDDPNTDTYVESEPDDSTLEAAGAGNKLRIKDRGVSIAKLWAMATSKILGRRTAAAGDIEELDANDAGLDGLAGKSSIVAKTADYELTAADSGKKFTNTGAGADIQFTLPAAAVGLRYAFTVHDSFEIDVIRAGADVILENDGSSKTHFCTATPGRTIRIECTKAATWTVEYMYGAWAPA
jgi:hypothetical protein